jgi:hypothetical protein
VKTIAPELSLTTFLFLLSVPTSDDLRFITTVYISDSNTTHA